MSLAGAALTLAAAPGLARADLPPDAPLQVQVKADAAAPAGAVSTGAQVVVKPKLPPKVDAQLAVSFAAGQRGDATPPWAGVSTLTPFAWNKAGVSLQAAWSANEGAKLQLDASDELRTQSFVGPSTVNVHPVSLDEAQGASVKAVAPLAQGLDLTLAAGVGADDGAVDLVQDGSVLRHVALRDERSDLSSRLAWTVTPKLSLELGDRMETRNMTWGYEGVADGYAAVEPKAAAVLKPFAQTEASLTVEQATSPLQPAKFAALAQAAETAADPAAGARLRPDEVWQVKAAVTRKFRKSGQLAIAYTHADLKSSTELVQIAPGVQAPGSVTGGQREQWDLSLNLPLDLVGLDALALQGSGLVRRSAIPDPITGLMRPPSGETPYEARLGLVADIPSSRLRLGVQSQATGPQTVYSLTRVDTVTVAPTVGAYVEYRPSDLALRLQLNDLAGVERRYASVLYGDSRDEAPTGETDRRVEGGPGFTLWLRKAM